MSDTAIRVAVLWCPDTELEARVFEAVARSLDSLTPRIEIVRPGMVLFLTLGPSRYFGGDEAMAQHAIKLARGAIEGFGAARVGVADGSFAASLAVRKASDAQAYLVPKGTSAAFLAPQSVHTLERPELCGVLARLGLLTLGQLAKLSRTDVIARFGAEGGVAHRLASGLDQHPPAMIDPPPEMEVVAELDPPVERVDQAAFAGKALADQFLDRLNDRGATCMRIVIAAQTEHGEELERYWRHEGALSAAAVADRVRWQLDGWLNGSSAARPSSGLIRLSIRPDEIVAAKGRQLGFWGGQTEAAERAAKAVARVQGLLGSAAVRVPERRGGRSPQEQVVAVPAETVDLDRSHIDGASVTAPWPGGLPGPAPTRIHKPSPEVQVLDEAGSTVLVDARASLSATPHRVKAQGRAWRQIRHWAGPWPLEERWWDPQRRCRKARLQVVLDDGVALLLVAKGGRWWLEATYD